MASVIGKLTGVDATPSTGVISGVASATSSISGTIVETFLKGLSAYDVAVKNGFIGSEEDWLASLRGDKVVLRNNDYVIQWKYSEEPDTEWRDLIEIDQTVDYNDVINKPLINGVELAGSVDMLDILDDVYVQKENFELISDNDIDDILDRLKGGDG